MLEICGMLQYILVIVASAAVGLVVVQAQRKYIIEEI